MKNKLIALVMAILMIVPFIVSCGDSGEEIKETVSSTPAGSAADSVDNKYAYIDEYVDDLAAEYNFNGSTFTFIDGAGSFPEKYEITGVLEDDALYSRYRELEDKFGITIDKQPRDAEGTEYGSAGEMIAEEVKRDVMANTGSFDIVCGGSVNCGRSLINNSLVRNINDMPGIDLSQSWWVSDMDRQLGIGDAIYSITGKANASHYWGANLIVFSKKIMRDFNITEDLYQVVKDGEWTVDKMFEIASAVPVNTSSSFDGTYRYYSSLDHGGFVYYIGAGFTVSQKDEDGNPYIENSLTSDQINFIDKMSGVMGDPTQNIDREKFRKEDDSGDIYSEDRVLFTSANLHHVSSIRNTDVDIGIIPVPKKDTDQKNYYAFSDSTWTMAFYFPLTLKDPEMSGVITEAMAALSEKHLEPAYYEKALKGRSTYDVESREMLDIIYSSVVIDMADMYKWGDLTSLINSAILGKDETVVSSYGTGAKMGNRAIKTLLRNISKEK